MRQTDGIRATSVQQPVGPGLAHVLVKRSSLRSGVGQFPLLLENLMNRLNGVGVVSPAVGRRAVDPAAAVPAAAREKLKAQAEAVANQHFDAFKDYAFDPTNTRAKKGLDDSYLKDVHFHDPLFEDINDRRSVMKMWELSGTGTTDNHITPRTAKFEGLVTGKNGEVLSKVTVPWDAKYNVQGNPVTNHSNTTLLINAEGKIVDQKDDWDLHKWVSQAIPLTNKIADKFENEPTIKRAVQEELDRDVSRLSRLFLRAAVTKDRVDDFFDHLSNSGLPARRPR